MKRKVAYVRWEGGFCHEMKISQNKNKNNELICGINISLCLTTSVCYALNPLSAIQES